jgi:hypothetical protein
VAQFGPADCTRRSGPALPVLVDEILPTSTYLLKLEEGGNLFGILAAFAACCLYNRELLPRLKYSRSGGTKCELIRFGVCEMRLFGMWIDQSRPTH